MQKPLQIVVYTIYIDSSVLKEGQDTMTTGERETWRQMLGELIHDSKVRSQIAETAGVSTRTLIRWSDGSSREPVFYSLSRVVAALPVEIQEQFRVLVRLEFPAWEAPLIGRVAEYPAELPRLVLERVIQLRTTRTRSVLFTSIASFLLAQLAAHLDPEKIGCCFSLIGCVMPPSGTGLPVRSMRERFTVCTASGGLSPAGSSYFLGAESLSGYVASTLTPQIVQLTPEAGLSLIPVKWEEGHRSAVALPIQQAENVAGTLTVSSPDAEFFTTSRISVLARYAELASLAFHDDEFFVPSRLRLAIMPSYMKQKDELSRIVPQLLAIYQEQQEKGREAEQMVERITEAHLLLLLYPTGNPPL